MKKVIEIRKYQGDEVVRAVDVTGKSDRQIDKIESGIMRNMNHEEYYTEIVITESEEN